MNEWYEELTSWIDAHGSPYGIQGVYPSLEDAEDFYDLGSDPQDVALQWIEHVLQVRSC